MHKANESFKRVIKSLQGELAKCKRDSEPSNIGTEVDSKDRDKSIIISLEKEREAYMVEVRELKNTIAILQARLIAIEKENNELMKAVQGRDMKINSQAEERHESGSLTSDYYLPRLSEGIGANSNDKDVVEEEEGEQWYHDCNATNTSLHMMAMDDKSPPLTVRKPQKQDIGIVRSSEDNVNISMGKSLTYNNGSSGEEGSSKSSLSMNASSMSDFRESTLLERQSLISILSMGEERNSMMSEDYFAESLQLQNVDNNAKVS